MSRRQTLIGSISRDIPQQEQVRIGRFGAWSPDRAIAASKVVVVSLRGRDLTNCIRAGPSLQAVFVIKHVSVDAHRVHMPAVVARAHARY